MARARWLLRRTSSHRLAARACRLLADRVTAAQMAELHALVAQMDAAGLRRDLDAYYPLNIAFHGAIVEGAANPVLAQTYAGLVSRLHLFRARGLVHGGGFESSNVEHRAIVAALAAEGRSNPDIAKTLYVSRKTVEKHLSAAYRKLGISARDELPAALAKE